MRNYLLFSMIFVISSIALYVFFAKPWYFNATEKHKQVGELRSIFAQGQDLQEKRDALQSELNTIPKEQRNLVENAISEYSPGNIVIFLLALEQLMYDKTGLPLDIRYSVGSKRTGSEGVVIIPVVFNFGEIQYDLMRQFLAGLQNWDRGVHIKSMQVALPGDENLTNRGFVSATITIEALFSSVSDTL